MSERFKNPVIKYTTDDLKTLPGSKLYFYETGTTTPKLVYQDVALTIPHAHPVVSDGAGIFPPIFLDGVYRVELKNSAGVTQSGWPVDYVGEESVGFVQGPNSSTLGALAVFDSTDGTSLANGPVPTNGGISLITAPITGVAGYLRLNSDESLSRLSTAQVKTDLSIPADTISALGLKAPLDSPVFTGNPTAPTPAAGDSDNSIATTAFVQSEFDRLTIENVSAISSFSPAVGSISYLKEYNIDTGKGGGPLLAKSGLITPDNGITFASATSGVYLERINVEKVTTDLFGYDDIYSMPNATLLNYFTAGGTASEQDGFGAGAKQLILQDRRDVNILAMGDSTGNANDEWVYLTAEGIAAMYPTHSVEYHLWDTTSYFSSVSISTGTGSNTIHVYNASIPGATAAYFLGDKRAALYNSYVMDLVIYNYGHNMGTAATYNQIYNFHISAIEEFISSQSSAEHVITIQNIDTEFPDYSALQASAMSAIAGVLGCGVIDIRTVFAEKQSAGNLTDWMLDLIHPNAVGEKVWANVVLSAFARDNTQNCHPVNLLAETRPTLIYNDYFYNWLWSDATPSGYTINSYATAEKDTFTFETKGYSALLTSTGGAGQIGILTNNAGGQLSKFVKTNGLTFAARVRPSTGSDFNCGRVEVDLGGGVVVSSWPRTEPKNGWYWSSVYVTEAQLNAATQLRLSIYSGDTGDTVNVDRISLTEGMAVIDSQFKPVTILEFYDPSKVIPKTVNDVLTIIGDQVAVVNAIDIYPGFGVNLTDLTIGESYTATWTTAVSGAGSGAYVRGYALQGAIQATAAPLNTNTVVFTAIADSASIQFEVTAAVTGTSFTVSDISVMLT